ncbi:MAG TPA: choice-of-anchor tandem repeat GloVer-containing protein, partial [Chthoniobacteraceae bacterium]|nr:choice-of-anchor tandem repeat GloVer-containing protein [Chthoniobacteraceae bacterium]
MLRLAVAVVSMVTAGASAQTFQSIFSFPLDGSKGLTPKATLTVGPDGSLYGTASEGGVGGAGTAFKVSTAGVFTPLGDFVPADTGKAPVARLVNIGDGFLYGVTSEGTGTAGDPLGTVFKLDPAGGLTKVFALPG